MSKPRRLTRKLFWQHWPEVAPGFAVNDHGFMRTSRDQCPIEAVASHLGIAPDGYCGLDLAIPTCPRPRWTQRVIDAADDRDKGATYRRLVEHIPGGGR